MIPHKKWPSGLACIDTVHSAADRAQRQEVTVDWYIKHGFDHDMALFRWVPGQTEYGLDPWRMIDGPYDLPTGTRIFVQVRDLKKAGLAILEGV